MGLETVELLMDLEDFFQVRIADADASACVTVGDTQKLIVRLLEEQHPAVVPRATAEVERDVWDGIMTVVSRNGYSVESIRPQSTWIGDITQCG